MPQAHADDNAGGGTAAMPGLSHHSAPKFDGKANSLKRFLNEVRALAKQKGLGDKEAIQAVVSYAPGSDYELWGSLTAARGDDWSEFEKELCNLYPGSEGDRKYNRGHVEALVRSAALIPVTDHIQLGEYYRSFLTITTFLKTKGRISDQECSAKFLEGLHYTFRAQLSAYLQIKDPTATHHIDDPWPTATLYEAALFVLSNRNGGATAEAPSLYTDRTIETGRVKTEEFDATQIAPFMDSEVFLNKMRSIFPQPVPSQQLYAPRTYADTRPTFNGMRTTAPAQYNVSTNAAPHVPAASQQNTFGGWDERPNICVFCSDPGHFQTRCPQAADYIRRGLCIRDDRLQLVLPNGMFIGRRLALGNNLKERVDAWYAMQGTAGAAPVASANFVDVSSTINPQTVDAHPEADPWAVFTHEVCDAEDGSTGLSARELEEIQVLQNVAASAQRKILETRTRAAAQYGPTTRAGKTYEGTPKPAVRAAPPKRDVPPHMAQKQRVHFGDQPKQDPPPVTAAPATVAAKEAAPTRSSKNPFVSGATPQFSYHTPIESPETIQDVVQQHLDAKITITNRQLLAVSPDVRRAVKEQIATKRLTNAPVVAVNEIEALDEDDEGGMPTDGRTDFGQRMASVETYLNDLVGRAEDTVVANHLEDLRCITLKAPGVGDIEAIMDDGSQIIATRADIWEKTGLPLRTDRLMVMESANKTKSDKKGLLQDFPVTIGEFTFYLQVQVVDNAPYEMLLGRPFMTLCQASCRHFTNGDSHLTLVDPNTQAVMTIPTHRRTRTGPTAVNVNSFF